MRRVRGTNREAGFTLPELLISIVIMSIVMAAITATILAMLDTESDASDRLSTSRTGETLTMWFEGDVASTRPANGADTTAGAWECAGAAPTGSNVLLLRMYDAVTGVTNIASYRVRPAASGGMFELTRSECAAGQASTTAVLVRGLPTAGSAVPALEPLSGPLTRVTLTVTVQGDGGPQSIVQVSGSPRKPPVDPVTTTTGAPTTIATTTSSTTTTTLPPDTTAPTAFDVQAIQASPFGRLRTGDALVLTFSELMNPSSILAGWNGASTDIEIDVINGNSPTPDSISFTDGVNLGQVTLGLSTWIFNGPSEVDATMTASVVGGRTVVTVVLDQNPSNTSQGNGAGTLRWTPSPAATDIAGNPATPTQVTESGASDVDF